MKVMPRTVILLLVLTLTAGLLAGCGPQKTATSGEKPVIKIGYLPITHSLPLVVADARHKSDFNNFRLELVKFGSWPDLTEALNSGQIQGAITMLELALASKAKGIPVEVVLLSHKNGDVLVAAPSIKDVKDLKGKRVAIPHRLSGHNILLYKALQQAGLAYSDVQEVEMAPPEMAAALARGEVAAYVVAEPFGAQAVVAGTGRVLKRAQDIIPGWECCGLVINQQLVRENPAAVQELVGSLVDTGHYIMSDRKTAIEMARPYIPVARETLEQSLQWIDYSDLMPTTEGLARIEQYLKEIPWDGQPGRLLPGGEIKLEELVDDRFARQAILPAPKN
ncbi:putative aliphatic sulfonates-binding protein precursor [Moorella thermoacetica]|nr:putative aliphatic sulfonates-binding protein precursor [Moorella thermoacetica]